MALNIFADLLLMALSSLAAEQIAEEVLPSYWAKDKLNWLYFKPFTCTPCLSFWLTVASCAIFHPMLIHPFFVVLLPIIVYLYQLSKNKNFDIK